MGLRKPPDKLRDKYEEYVSPMYTDYLDYLAKKGSLASDTNPALVILEHIDEEMESVQSFEEAYEGNRNSRGAKEARQMSNMDFNFVLGLQKQDMGLLGDAAKKKTAREYLHHEMLLVDFLYFSGKYTLNGPFLNSGDKLVKAAVQSKVARIGEDDLNEEQKKTIGIELKTEEDEDEEENDEIENEVEATDGWL